MDRFNDDPQFIAKGEQLKFEVANPTGGSSGRKKQGYNNSGSSFKDGQGAPIVPIITQFKPPENMSGRL